jgi:hypothetical protein
MLKHKELKAAMASKLALYGIQASDEMTERELCLFVGEALGRHRSYNVKYGDFLNAFVIKSIRPVHEPFEFRPLDSRKCRHPRLADIEAAQPPLYTPTSVGNGPENSKVWTR